MTRHVLTDGRTQDDLLFCPNKQKKPQYDQDSVMRPAIFKKNTNQGTCKATPWDYNQHRLWKML